MGDVAGWVTTIATVAAAIATALTAWFLAKDRGERQEAGLPILFHHGVSTDPSPTVLVLAINPSEEQWIVEFIRVETTGYEIAFLRETAESDGYGGPVYAVGEAGRQATIGRAILPAKRAPNTQQIIARIAIYPSEDSRVPLGLSARVASSPRRKRSRRQTATISITD